MNGWKSKESCIRRIEEIKEDVQSTISEKESVFDLIRGMCFGWFNMSKRKR